MAGIARVPAISQVKPGIVAGITRVPAIRAASGGKVERSRSANQLVNHAAHGRAEEAAVLLSPLRHVKEKARPTWIQRQGQGDVLNLTAAVLALLNYLFAPKE